MEVSSAPPDLQPYIDECLQCYRICLETAMHHCLAIGGRQIEPEHFRLMHSCADVCRTAADFMLSELPLYLQVCSACAEICEVCGENCERVGGMDECSSACRACAQSCRELVRKTGVQTPSATAFEYRVPRRFSM